MTVYLDIILLENLCMNYIILFATGIITKNAIKQINIILSSILGGIYSIISFMNILEIYSNIVMKIILSIVMIYIAYQPKNIINLFKQLVIFYLTSFAFGGCAFFLLYFVRPQDILMKNGVLIGTYPIKIALLGGIVGFVILNIAFKVVKGRISKKDIFCEVEIYFKENISNIRAMIDTGNLLKDPITGSPVIVVESNELKELIPLEILENINKIISGGREDILTNISEDYISKFRVIPFSSLGRQNGLLLGFKADKIIIKKDDSEKEVNNIIVGIYDKCLTKNGTYTGLIGLDIIEEGSDINERIADFKI